MTDAASSRVAAGYAELHCHSFFSLLDGASSPEALVMQARQLGLHALAMTDHDSLAGAVRLAVAAGRAGLHVIYGAEVTLEDGAHVTLLAETPAGYANLCQLITASRVAQLPADAAWPGKVTPALAWATLARHTQGLLALTGCRRGPVAAPLLREEGATAQRGLAHLQDLFGREHLYIEVQHHSLPDDDRLVRRLLGLAHRNALPVVATHNVHYATADRGPLRDALLAVRSHMTLPEARRAGHLPLNRTYALPSPAAMARRFVERPDALAQTIAIADRCHVTLDFSAHRLPAFVHTTAAVSAPSRAPFPMLYDLCHASLAVRYPELRPVVLKQLAHELEIIEQAGLAEYFLVVWDIVRFARAQGIRCQGRGSAANSIVAYLLGITSIDPLAHDLLFERFLSSDRFTMPDIDIDFAADRREEVIQYVYRKYGHSHTAMVCNHVTYQARSALRDLGKVLALPDATIAQIERRLDTHDPAAAADALTAWLATDAPAVDPASAPAPSATPSALHHLITLLRQIADCPRHLSIHSGGMLITRAPLDQITPLEPATMPGRFVCQWDKESVEDAGLIKIDLLALRTLGLIDEALHHIAAAGDVAPELDALPLDDPAIYRMLQQADTIGAFQVESRAQQQMLPRLSPRSFADIAVEIAIVRPGPIQGGAVHPYLRRRAGEEPVHYLHPSLEPVLRESLGVLLFQEQAIRVAVAVAGFAPGEADRLRRALARERAQEEMAALRSRFVHGAMAQGITTTTAEAIFAQLAAFAGYGFCKSHAASFALIAYQTLWLKHYHAPAFYCALLNQQPMGFYPPEVIIGDARRHGVETLPPEINRSAWQYTLERLDNRRWALRTGLQVVAALGDQAWARIAAARAAGRFVDLGDFCVRTRLPADAVRSLIRAGVCDSFGARRDLLWRLGELDYRPDAFDLTVAAATATAVAVSAATATAVAVSAATATAVAVALPALDASEQTAWEYELMGASPGCQLLAHYRPHLRGQGILSTWQVKQEEAGQRVRVAGYVVVRQRPATAKGILFMSLEDECGLLDLVVKPDVYTRLREVIRGSPLLIAEGVVQRSHRAVSVLLWQAQQLA